MCEGNRLQRPKSKKKEKFLFLKLKIPMEPRVKKNKEYIEEDKKKKGIKNKIKYLKFKSKFLCQKVIKEAENKRIESFTKKEIFKIFVEFRISNKK